VILGQLAGTKLADEIPESWQTRFQEITGLQAPRFLHDKETPTLSQVDHDRIGRIVAESITRVQDLVFPLLGIEK
jgi:hypothetical protein